jgi:hypothetical protein
LWSFQKPVRFQRPDPGITSVKSAFRGSKLYYNKVNNVFINKDKIIFVKNKLKISSKPLELDDFFQFYSVRS